MGARECRALTDMVAMGTWGTPCNLSAKRDCAGPLLLDSGASRRISVLATCVRRGMWCYGFAAPPSQADLARAPLLERAQPAPLAGHALMLPAEPRIAQIVLTSRSTRQAHPTPTIVLVIRATLCWWTARVRRYVITHQWSRLANSARHFNKLSKSKRVTQTRIQSH